MKRVLAVIVLVAVGTALVGATIMTMNMAYAKPKDPKHTLKCDEETGSCRAWCSEAGDTKFCFTAGECNKFRQERDGTKCEKTTIHD
jgi:hypothetical protein